MGLWNLGSVSEVVLAIVDNIPSTLSGIQLNALADRKRRFIEEYTGLSVGSVGIDLRWQGILTNLTVAEVTSLMALTGADVSSIRLGELSIGKGAGGNLDMVSKSFHEKAMEELRAVGMKPRYYQAFG